MIAHAAIESYKVVIGFAGSHFPRTLSELRLVLLCHGHLECLRALHHLTSLGVHSAENLRSEASDAGHALSLNPK